MTVNDATTMMSARTELIMICWMVSAVKRGWLSSSQSIV